MKKAACIIGAILFLVLLYWPSEKPEDDYAFTKNAQGDIVSKNGVEYALFAVEWDISVLGDLEYLGNIQGERKLSCTSGYWLRIGMFGLEEAENDNILIRRMSNNEWYSIYRKASLPEFDISEDNCIRFEFIPWPECNDGNADHISCGDGITDPSEITAFLTEVRAQKSPEEAGLYDLVRKPDGCLENCYYCGEIYGYFAEEPNLVIKMLVRSYDDLAYSVYMGDTQYVLPNHWFQRLQAESET